MTITLGNSPFGTESTGVFNFTRDGPAHVLYWEDSPRRLRAVFGGHTVADSTRVKLLHETGHLPVPYFPWEDIDESVLEPTDHTTHCPFKGDAAYWSVRTSQRHAENALWCYREPFESTPPIAGHAAFDFAAPDAWYEEDELIRGHVRDPYHRVDVRQSSRHVEVQVLGEKLAESDRPLVLFETGLPARYYIPAADVRTELLSPSGTTTHCPYKGDTIYYTVKTGEGESVDAAWSYPEPFPEAAKAAAAVCFFGDDVTVTVDGKPG